MTDIADINPNVPPTKYCPMCGRVKPASEFHKNSKSKDGLQGRCKECAKVNSAMYYSAFKADIKKKRQDNSEAVNAYQRRYRNAHLEASRQSSANYYSAHKEEILSKRKERYSRTRTSEEKALTNPELYNEYVCMQCGKKFYVLKSTVRSYHKQNRPDPKFCSSNCVALNRRENAQKAKQNQD